MRSFRHIDNSDVSTTNRQQRSFSRKMMLLSCCALFIILSAALTFVNVSSTQKAHAASWNQIFNEDFSGPAGSGLNTSNWKYDTGTGWGTGEIETMSSSTANVQQDGNGHLQITAIRDANGNWTSGRIETQRADFAAPVGGELEVSASIQQPNVSGAAAAGYWPAFWMLGAQYRVDQNWPNDGEIDIMEDINGLSSVFGTLHCGVDPGGPCNETTGIGSGQHACPGCQTSYHTYSVIVDRSVSPEQIRWYLDGGQIFSVSANQMDANTWANAVDHSFFIILDLAMGGAFPNGVCNCTSPTSSTASGANLNVDYVRVYTAGGASSTPTATPTSTSVPTPTPTHGTGATCSVHYSITNQWQGGFGANVTINNTGSTTINGWTLTWSFANGQTITQLWNGSPTQSGSTVSVSNLSYNGTIAPGGNTNFGFNGSWNGSNSAPTAFKLNGSTCTTV